MVEDWGVEVGWKTATRFEDSDITRKRADTKTPAEEHRQQPEKEYAGDIERKENGEQLSPHAIANAWNAANLGIMGVVEDLKRAYTINEHAMIKEAMSESPMTRAVARMEIDRHQTEKRVSARGEASAPKWRRLEVRDLAGEK